MGRIQRGIKWVAAGALFAALSACGSDEGPGIGVDILAQTDSSGSDGAAGQDVYTPPVEMDPVLAASLQALLDEHVAFSADPGATLAVRTGDGAWWSGASGISELQTEREMEPGFGFRVGSNTKPFVATVVLQLVDEGLIALDDLLSDYIPGYPQWGQVTIRHLLSMRSGIPDYLTNVNLMLDFIVEPGTPKGVDVILSYVENEPVLYAPGEGATYSNSNYLLLGMIIEDVTGSTVDQEIRARLVDSLGLTGTFLDMTGEVRDDVARGYMDLALVGQIFGVPASIVALLPEESQYEGTIVDTSYIFHPSLTWSAGALIATASDMARFMYALLNGDLLKPETLLEMKDTVDTQILGVPVPYGLGMQVRPTAHGTAYGHGGLNFGYQAGTYYLPDLDVTFSHMHNYLPEQSAGLENEVMDLLANGVEEPIEPCLSPDGFFHPYEGPVAHARFKGPVNGLGEEAPVPGIAHLVWLQEEGKVPLYGWGSQANLAVQGLQTRLQIQSLAPADPENDKQMRLTIISLDPGVVFLLDDEGQYELNLSNPGAAIFTVADLDLNLFGNPVKMCFKAVNDAARPSHFRICNPDTFKPEAGNMLKFYGSFAIETDPAKVEATLAYFEIPICMCIGGDGVWGPCSGT